MRLSVVGLGCVGLCISTSFATRKFKVTCLDVDESKLELIRRGKPLIYEPQLEEHLVEGINSDFLTFTSDWDYLVENSDMSFVTVSTPSKSNGAIDLRYVKSAILKLGEALKKKSDYHLVVVKSTITPGTTEELVKPTLERHSGKICQDDFGLCFNPEFLREGSAMNDMLNPSRIIIGSDSEKSADILKGIYLDFYKETPPPILVTNFPTAEMIKYVNNAFLATKVSFMNEIANICERIPELDVKIVTGALGLDPRINPKFLNAGLGFGGSCLPKDVEALISLSYELGCKPKILKAVLEVNEQQPLRVIKLIKDELKMLCGKRIAILGLAFKPETDDIRGAPSLRIIDALISEGAQVSVYDPKALKNAKRIFGSQVEYCASMEECINNAECCILVTEWKEFERLTPEDFKSLMKIPLLVDGRRMFNPKTFGERIKYFGVGLARLYRSILD